VFITASALAKNVLGAVNGMGQMSVSIAHAFGPMTAAPIFAFSKDHDILGGHAVFAVLCIPAVGLLWRPTYPKSCRIGMMMSEGMSDARILACLLRAISPTTFVTLGMHRSIHKCKI
jgi:hypothetical protein